MRPTGMNKIFPISSSPFPKHALPAFTPSNRGLVSLGRYKKVATGSASLSGTTRSAPLIAIGLKPLAVRHGGCVRVAFGSAGLTLVAPVLQART